MQVNINFMPIGKEEFEAVIKRNFKDTKIIILINIPLKNLFIMLRSVTRVWVGLKVGLKLGLPGGICLNKGPYYM